MSIGKYAFHYGITTGFVLALISLLFFLPGTGGLVNMACLIALVLLTLHFVRRYRDRFNGGTLTSGQAFRLTFLMLLYVGIIAALFMGFEMGIKLSGSSDEMFQTLRDTYDQMGISVPDDMIYTVISLLPYIGAFFAFVAHLIVGAILGGIYSSTLKRLPPPPAPPAFENKQEA